MIYIDANVFIYAAVDADARGQAASVALQEALSSGACTSVLTADELLWAVEKYLGREQARSKAREMLAMDLALVDVRANDLRSALAVHEQGLDPRDAIHAAVALRMGCREILSSDQDFDHVQGLARRAY